ncbi:hypothetical protein GS597_09255 [Synechococcales cyanobacterium C]|uniref:Uncharacterized protein n=1 Tax=Petrachloros mirabilis ULC683 TaxID=2781853 RepID=A0A8K1ZWY5_9CYAN|nr:hypothetical protein [Petrachloros mirabilis]NCJ06689.1 hypothetical protein [Petrachloros mirabilis ULC683]
MTKQSEIFLTKQYREAGVTFVNADGTTIKTLIAAGADDSNVIGLSITSTDGTARDLLLYKQIGGTDYLIGHVDIPANAGFNGVANQVDGLNITNLPANCIDSAGNLFMSLPAGTTLRAAMKTSVTASQTITVNIVLEDY